MQIKDIYAYKGYANFIAYASSSSLSSLLLSLTLCQQIAGICSRRPTEAWEAYAPSEACCSPPLPSMVLNTAPQLHQQEEKN